MHNTIKPPTTTPTSTHSHTLPTRTISVYSSNSVSCGYRGEGRSFRQMKGRGLLHGALFRVSGDSRVEEGQGMEVVGVWVMLLNE